MNLKVVNDYFEHPNISQSFLKCFIKDQPRSLQRVKESKYYYEEKKHFIRGSLIDFICTMNSNEIDELYYIDEFINKPPPGILSIIHEIVDEKLEFEEQNILDIARNQEYQKNWKDDTIVRSVLKFEDYYKQLLDIGNKQIIPADDWNIAVECSNSLLNGEFTKSYFNKYIEYQKALYVGNRKCLIDMFYINHEKKEFRIIDIKSTGDYLESFNIFKWRYDFQMAWYNDIAQMAYPEYKALNPIILAVSKKEPEFAEPFEFTQETLNIGRKGGKKEGKELIGYEQCLNNYNYWIENNNIYNSLLIKNKVNYV